MAIQSFQFLNTSVDPIVTAAHPDKDASWAINQTVGGQPGPFQCFPSDFEEEALLGVDPDRFARGNAKEEGIEASHIVKKSRGAHVTLTGQGALWVIIVSHVPATARHLLDHVGTGGEQLPELFGRISTGETAGHADHGNGLSHPHPCPPPGWGWELSGGLFVF